MDKERAKFILGSFRPDGDDADEPAFAEALGLAARDRELGEWLADERSQDAAFAAMLTAIEIPEDLREAIFEVLEGAQDRPAEFDAVFVSALASLKPPEGLQDEILAAMEIEDSRLKTPERSRGLFLRVALWMTSVAAVIALIIGVGVFFAGAGGKALAGKTPGELQESAISLLEDPLLSLDMQNDRQAFLNQWLADRDLPIPGQLPRGLEGVRGIGCMRLEIGEEKWRGSLISYLKDGRRVHLVVVEREALKGSAMSGLESAVVRCFNCPKNPGWAMTRWADDAHAYFLLSKMEAGQLAGLF
jgi:hypothetical protein